jgi:hypothetical protein
VRTLDEYPNGGRGMEGFFAFLSERYRILLRRRLGERAPWTLDPVLQAWRFCNVRREDDKVTIWFRENIRDPLKNDPKVFFATIAFRWFNTPAAGLVLKPWLMNGVWDRAAIQQELEIKAEAESIFTGAFMINSAPGLPKHIDVLDNLDWVRANLSPARVTRDLWTKRAMMDHLLQAPRLGNFAAYQVVVDLQYTYLLLHAPDLNTFTVAGPGCAKGISLMVYDQPEGFYRYGSKGDQEKMLGVMRDCLDASRDPKLWPSNWPPFVLSDIENGFCEYAKWRTGHAGLRLKRKFTPSV